MNETYGLLSSDSGGPIPLCGVKVEGDILGRGARVRLYQRFRNEDSKAIEAVYKFPLAEGSAVCGFEARVDGKTIHGQVEDREKAFEMYDDALAGGDGGMLLDEERPNIFTLSVGNLKPGAEAVIEIEYVTLLDMEGHRTRFFLPTTISPRYIPEDMHDDDGIPVDSRLHPPYAADVPYGLSISLNIHQGGLLKCVESPSHPIKIEDLKGDPVHVTLSAESVQMDRDFILYMDCFDTFQSRAYRMKHDGETFLQLDLCLPNPDDEQGTSGRAAVTQEVIFVADCSGSMSGDSIKEAKKAIEVCLKGLEEETLFNIYRFGSSFEHLFRISEGYNKTSLDKALHYLNAMDADLGGTEILKPLRHIYSSSSEGKARNIILLTDGEVGNEGEILALVKKNHGATRMYSLGIGTGPNDYFIKGIARAGRGAYEFIYPGERIEPKVLRVFSKVTRQGLAEPALLWGEGTVDQAPLEPAIFPDTPVTLFAKCKTGGLPGGKVKVRGKLNGMDREWEIDVLQSNHEDLPIPVLWARERIRDMEESGEAIGIAGSRQRERKQARWNEQVIELSKKYGILSQATSFVAIEERETQDKSTDDMALRKVPVLVTAGWHGIGGIRASYAGTPPLFSAGPDMRVEADQICYNLRDESRAYPSSRPWIFEHDAGGYDTRLSLEQSEKTDVLLSILSRQRAEGGMEIDQELADLLGMDLDAIKRFSNDLKVGIPVDKFLLLSTAIILQVLDLRFSDQVAMWSRVVRKTKSWYQKMAQKGNPSIDGKDLREWAEAFVKRGPANIRLE